MIINRIDSAKAYLEGCRGPTERDDSETDGECAKAGTEKTLWQKDSDGAAANEAKGPALTRKNMVYVAKKYNNKSIRVWL